MNSNQNHTSGTLLTRKQVGELLNIGTAAIISLEKRGHLRPIRLNRRVYRYDPAQVDVMKRSLSL
jgi:hypothetical protein